MFTGIIKAVGRIAEIEQHENDVRMRFAVDSLNLLELPQGASIAVNGACLTATELDEHSFTADLSAETLRVTDLGALRVDSPVNIEPAMRMSDSLDGHLVTGHIDGIGEVSGIEQQGRARLLTIELPEGLARYVARKGSVAVDGVSLTVNSVGASSFSVAIIPHTQSATIIQHYEVGTTVNIEVDIVARYVERLAEHSQ